MSFSFSPSSRSDTPYTVQALGQKLSVLSPGSPAPGLPVPAFFVPTSSFPLLPDASCSCKSAFHWAAACTPGLSRYPASISSPLSCPPLIPGSRRLRSPSQSLAITPAGSTSSTRKQAAAAPSTAQVCLLEPGSFPVPEVLFPWRFPGLCPDRLSCSTRSRNLSSIYWKASFSLAVLRSFPESSHPSLFLTAPPPHWPGNPAASSWSWTTGTSPGAQEGHTGPLPL